MGARQNGFLAAVTRDLRWCAGRVALPVLSLLMGSAGAAELPFKIVDPTQEWTIAAVNKEVAPNLTCEAIGRHAGGQDRLIALSSPQGKNVDETLAQFATRLRDSFGAYECTPLSEGPATKFGYEGLDLGFELKNEESTRSCELFVFVEGETEWALLYSRPKDVAVNSKPVFELLEKREPAPPGTVALEPFKVKGVPVTSFPISVEVTRNADQNRVTRIVITEVHAGARGDGIVLKAGDLITAINGKRSTDFYGGLGKESELGRIFLNRSAGDQVDLEIMPVEGKKSVQVTLRVPFMRAFGDMWR